MTSTLAQTGTADQTSTADETSTADRTSTGAAGEFATHRRFTVHATGGLDAVLKVVAALRGRRYHVRDLDVEIGEGVATSRVTCTAVLTASGGALLLEQLRRMPAVVSAEPS